jgi:c(7)-type cytochrome triheme protein
MSYLACRSGGAVRTRSFGHFLSLLVSLLVWQPSWAYWDLPPSPPAEEYGNIRISRASEKNNLRPVSFSHWSHRLRYACSVCHLELEFQMKVNATEITEAANRSGKYCGACHDGVTAFGHERENCDTCHRGDSVYSKEKSGKLKSFPGSRFGNKVDWVRAEKEGRIKPRKHVFSNNDRLSYEKTVHLKQYSLVPPAVFPHREHNVWLDCSNCHPEIFTIQGRATKNFSMSESLKGEFCGVCHLTVAFPFNDCKRCHPSMKE